MKRIPAHLAHVTKRHSRQAGYAAAVALGGAALAFPGAAHAAVTARPAPDLPASPDGIFRHEARTVVTVQRQQASAMMVHQVRAGESISGVALKSCDGKAQDWTGIYQASRARHLTGLDADKITVGQELAVNCEYVPAELKYAGTPQVSAPKHGATTAVARVTRSGGLSYGHPNFCGDGDGDGWDVNCQARTASPAAVPQFRGRSAAVAVASAGSFGSVSPGSFGGIEQCIISRESGGNSQVMNASGHYGLFQFSASTWAGHGGNPASFGHASVSEQEAVFAATVRADGYSDWTPYDGC